MNKQNILTTGWKKKKHLPLYFQQLYFTAGGTTLPQAFNQNISSMTCTEYFIFQIYVKSRNLQSEWFESDWRKIVHVNTVVDSVFFFFLHFLIRSLEESLILTTEFWKIIKLIQLRIKSIYDDIRIWSAVVLAAFQTQVLHILLGFLNLFFSPKKTPLLSEMTIHIQALDLLNHKPHTAFTDHTTYQDRSRLSISRLHSAAVYILKLSTEPSQKHTCTCLIQRGYVSL